MNYLFAYGSLMKGQSASHILESSKYIGKYLLPDYAMFDIGEFPGIVPCKGENVIGEVYEIQDDLIPYIDEYERVGELYTRKTLIVSSINKNISAMVYEYNKEVAGKKLLRMEWNAKETDYVWYACYGSNIMEERFLYYMKGGNYSLTGKSYSGCRDKSMWCNEKMCIFPGRMYFAKESSSWDGKGVSFYDPDGNGFTFMKTYKIKRSQLFDIQLQECFSEDISGKKVSKSNWYAKIICLGISDDDNPIFTLTNEEKLEENEPGVKYLELIKEALRLSLGNKSIIEIETYIKNCMPLIDNSKKITKGSSLKTIKITKSETILCKLCKKNVSINHSLNGYCKDCLKMQVEQTILTCKKCKTKIPYSNYDKYIKNLKKPSYCIECYKNLEFNECDICHKKLVSNKLKKGKRTKKGICYDCRNISYDNKEYKCTECDQKIIFSNWDYYIKGRDFPNTLCSKCFNDTAPCEICGREFPQSRLNSGDRTMGICNDCSHEDYYGITCDRCRDSLFSNYQYYVLGYDSKELFGNTYCKYCFSYMNEITEKKDCRRCGCTLSFSRAFVDFCNGNTPNYCRDCKGLPPKQKYW